jgi:hypothetical protein
MKFFLKIALFDIQHFVKITGCYKYIIRFSVGGDISLQIQDALTALERF